MFSCVVHACPTCTLIYCFIPQYHNRNYFRFRVGREGGREGHNIYSTLLSLVIFIVQGLDYLHKRNKMHRDIKVCKERERKVQNSLVYLMPIGSQHTSDWWWRCEARWGRIVVFFGFSGVIASCYCCFFHFSWFWNCCPIDTDLVEEEILHRDTILVRQIALRYFVLNVPFPMSPPLPSVYLFRMAPEVAAVERKGGYNHLCDIWAVGITAIELAEMQPPMFDLHPMRSVSLPLSLSLTVSPSLSSSPYSFITYSFLFPELFI